MEHDKTKLIEWNKVGLNVEGWNMVDLSVLLEKLLTVSGVMVRYCAQVSCSYFMHTYVYQMGPFSRCKSFVVAYLVMLAT
jgi:hypothetical protein